VFDLVQPAGTGGRGINQHGLARTDEAERSVQPPTGQERAPVCAFHVDLLAT
jgi:hypothetical protein